MGRLTSLSLFFLFGEGPRTKLLCIAYDEIRAHTHVHPVVDTQLLKLDGRGTYFSYSYFLLSSVLSFLLSRRSSTVSRADRS